MEVENNKMPQNEIVDNALRFVREYLRQNGCRILARVPDLKAPKLLFRDENDVNSYVIIKPHFANETVQLSKKRIDTKHQGFYADLIIDGKRGSLMHNSPVNFIFNGLEPIEKKIEEGIFIDPPTRDYTIKTDTQPQYPKLPTLYL